MEELDKTSDFLFYNSDDGNQTVQVIVGEETVWTTQRGMSEIFNVTTQNISIHLSNIFESGELDENSVCKEFLHTATDGKDYKMKFYSLDAIISVGYRVNSYNATKFRIWATKVLKEYLIKGFAMDDERLKQGNNLFNKDYFKELLQRIREIRASERMFYEKVKELYATSVDYDSKAPETTLFFQKVQNKLEYAIVGQTAAEIIKTRADSQQPHMNLKTFKNVKKEGGDIQKADITIAKNYLDEEELRELNLLVNIFLDQAELFAEKNRLMKMQDWVNRLDALLRFNEYKVLENAGSIKKEVADKFAEGEYNKYKVIKNLAFNKDFDKVVSQIKGGNSLPKEIIIVEKKDESDFDKALKGLLKTPPPKKDK